MKYFVIISTVLLFASCGSFLYSPAIATTKEAVKKGDYAIAGGVGGLPETRPHALRPVTAGFYGTLGYGFSNRVSFHASAWGALQSYWFMGLRTGYSGHFKIILKQQDRSRIELIPRGAFVMHKNVISGYGFGITALYVRDISKHWYFYAGAGPAAGYQDAYSRVPGINPDGSAIISHVGIAAKVISGLSCIMEFNPLYSSNYRDRVNTFILPGTTSLIFHLKAKSS